MSRLDVVMVREYTNRDGEKKPAFTKIGAAFPLKSGKGYQAIMDAMPAPVDGQYKVLLMEPQEKRQGYVDDRGNVQTVPLDDEIPF